MKKCENQKSCPVECLQQKYDIRSYAQDLKDDDVTDRAFKIPGWNKSREETQEYVKYVKNCCLKL